MLCAKPTRPLLPGEVVINPDSMANINICGDFDRFKTFTANENLKLIGIANTTAKGQGLVQFALTDTKGKSIQFEMNAYYLPSYGPGLLVSTNMLTTKGHCTFAQSEIGGKLVTPSGSTIMFKRDANNLPFAIGTMNVTANLTAANIITSEPVGTLNVYATTTTVKKNTVINKTAASPATETQGQQKTTISEESIRSTQNICVYAIRDFRKDQKCKNRDIIITM